MSVEPLPDIMTKEEVAAQLRVHVKTVERLIRKRQLTSTQIGRRVFVRRDKLRADIDRMTRPACPEDSSNTEDTGSTDDQTGDRPICSAPGTKGGTDETARSAELHSALQTLRKPRTD